MGHEWGVFAPGLQEPGHGGAGIAPPAAQPRPRAAGVARAGSRARLGIVLNLAPMQAATASRGGPRARPGSKTAGWCAGTWTRCSMAAYPTDVLDFLGADAPRVEAGDMAAIAAPMDFLGINYYSRSVASADGPGCASGSGLALTDMGWEVFPAGLTKLLLRLYRDWPCRRCTSRRTAPHFATRWSTAGARPERWPTSSPHRRRGRCAGAGRAGGGLHGVEPARQLRVGLGLREALRHRARGLRDAAPHVEGQRATGTAISCGGSGQRSARPRPGGA